MAWHNFERAIRDGELKVLNSHRACIYIISGFFYSHSTKLFHDLQTTRSLISRTVITHIQVNSIL
jgi:hypothetical protein